MKQTRNILLLALLFLCISMFLSYFIIKSNDTAKRATDIEEQLNKTAGDLNTLLKRHEYLPYLLSTEQRFIELFEIDEAEEYNAALNRINAFLERANITAETNAIYLLDDTGIVIASSDWNDKNTVIGTNFSNRDYFIAAMQNRLGRDFSSDPSTALKYYYFAKAIQRNHKRFGAIVVKTNMNDMIFNWSLGSMDFMITDEDRIVFLTSQKQWNKKALTPIPASRKDSVNIQNRYPEHDIQVMQTSFQSAVDFHRNNIRINNENHLIVSRSIPLTHWYLSILSKRNTGIDGVFKRFLWTSLVLFLLTALAVLFVFYLRQKDSYEKQIRMELEQKVEQRTKALKQTQEELVQAAKLAAVGQLSASINHEINNPLSAIRNYAANAQEFLHRQSYDTVESNLLKITQLTDHMAAITKQLKSFTRKSKGEIKAVNIHQAINSALTILQAKINQPHIEIIRDEELENVDISADPQWLSQILVNLFTNAISACKNQPDPTIRIDIKQDSQPSFCCIHIIDNGMGIDEEVLQHIFEPFFTTKSSSKGLGLGLSITHKLVKDLNGTINVQNLDTGGARFTICLPQGRL